MDSCESIYVIISRFRREIIWRFATQMLHTFLQEAHCEIMSRYVTLLKVSLNVLILSGGRIFPCSSCACIYKGCCADISRVCIIKDVSLLVEVDAMSLLSLCFNLMVMHCWQIGIWCLWKFCNEVCHYMLQVWMEILFS